MAKLVLCWLPMTGKSEVVSNSIRSACSSIKSRLPIGFNKEGWPSKRLMIYLYKRSLISETAVFFDLRYSTNGPKEIVLLITGRDWSLAGSAVSILDLFKGFNAGMSSSSIVEKFRIKGSV